ncbi:pirin family protein [Herbaspirillum sp. RTI4]|uniref:pirin family protein n=1 Tax=Herbaspirillum sp. RTI4 TaxID=3048640 RepID=UPI002AB4B11F|nr:pirin family protein [Herbaspirillum sp. RTI4]MDY7578909.1 pirin family protein [Herbaspirillum sp. RTI4]MEA9981998.1 pirin family protein [Herbaspirillum sp. RTI4]
MPHSHSRQVEQLITGVPVQDGAGVRMMRILTPNLQRRLDPFLMLDAFHSDTPDDYLAGFPNHPHRGFETVTYMLAGRMRHRDNAGNEGLLEPGGMQWMTAGRGIVHSELPEQEDGLMSGFQLWVNLAAADKMITPAYRDLPAAEIPEVTPLAGVAVRVLAGSAFGVAGAVQKATTEPLYLDVRMAAGTAQVFDIPDSHNAFLFVIQGELAIGAERLAVGARNMAILSNAEPGAGVAVQALATETHFLLIAGRPLLEPIVQWGPFVMNSREQVEQAMEDFHAGRFGPEVV